MRKGLSLSIFGVMPAWLLVASLSMAQIPPVSNPQKAGCFDTRNNYVRCGERFVAEYQGAVYDCVCNCSGNDQCTPRSSSDNIRTRDGAFTPNLDNSDAVDQESGRIRKYEEKLEQERRDTFQRNHENLVKSLKGSGATPLTLKNSGNASTLGLKPSTPAPAAPVNAVTPEMQQALLTDVSIKLKERASSPSREGAEILRSLKTNAPPSLDQDPFASLAAGDVILIDRIPTEDRDKYSWKDIALSQTINFLDRLGSAGTNSQASHAALFLGEKNGKRWFLNNTTEYGPVIIQESEFLRLYGGRNMDFARLIGKPISEAEGKEIWQAAHEQRETKKYGIWSKDRLVCSESARWALMSTGRDVPGRKADDVKLLGSPTGLNKKSFVSFSPADFYDSWQYFIIRPLTR